jgi:hypothetical protein
MEPDVHEVSYYEVELTDGSTYYVLAEDAGNVEKAGDLSPHVDGGEIAEPDEAIEPKRGWLYRPNFDSEDWGVADTEKEAWRELLDAYASHSDEREDWETAALKSAGLCVMCEHDLPDEPFGMDDDCCSEKCADSQQEQGGPEPGDYVTSDYEEFYEFEGTGSGPIVQTTTDNWRVAVQEHMNEQEFWPNVWYERERGGYDLLNLSC